MIIMIIVTGIQCGVSGGVSCRSLGYFTYQPLFLSQPGSVLAPTDLHLQRSLAACSYHNIDQSVHLCCVDFIITVI